MGLEPGGLFHEFPEDAFIIAMFFLKVNKTGKTFLSFFDIFPVFYNFDASCAIFEKSAVPNESSERRVEIYIVG